MKKYFLLTSVLALAACGGGSGGGGGAGGARAVILPALPAGLPDAISQENATSNEYVTKMKSEVVVAAKGGHSYLARSSAPIAGDDGFTFTSYRLDDVKFFAADAKTTQDGYLNLGINADGKIDRMYMVVGGVGANAAIARTDDESNRFKAPIFEYVEDELKATIPNTGQTTDDLNAIRSTEKGYWELDGDNWKYYKYGDQAVYRTIGVSGTNATTMDSLNALREAQGLPVRGHWNRTYEHLPVVTYGDDIDGHGTKLQYSDFGHFNPVYQTKNVNLTSGTEDGTAGGSWTSAVSKTPRDNDAVNAEIAKEDYQLFAGGYAIKGDTMSDSRPSLDPIMGATYKGMAIGRVYTSIDGDNRDQRAANFVAYGITDTGDNNDGKDIAKAFKTQNATMKITQSGGQVVETLNMPFNTHAVGDKYYDIEIQQIGNTIDHVSFTGNESEIASQYRLYDAEAHWDTPNASFNPGYYGVDTATEAAGTAEIRATYDLTNGAERDYEVQAAWGMIKQ